MIRCSGDERWGFRASNVSASPDHGGGADWGEARMTCVSKEQSSLAPLYSTIRQARQVTLCSGRPQAKLSCEPVSIVTSGSRCIGVNNLYFLSNPCDGSK